MIKPLFPILLLIASLVTVWGSEAQAAKKTVCTITVNSADEKEMFQSRLPKDKFDFVELVESGRPDWLASACHKGVQCDVLVISGHFAGTNFFSEEIQTQEYLPVDEMERVACSDSCPALFSKLKEVYLFGCNTLNSDVIEGDTASIARSVSQPGKRDGQQAKNERLAHGESSRDRMRRIFSDVPVIYGFSSKAPIGAIAGGMLGKYFQNTGPGEIGTGKISSRLVGHFTSTSLVTASGMRDTDPQAGYRNEVCKFFDERIAPAKKADFIHQIFERNAADVRVFFDRIEKFSTAMTDADRREPALARELDEIAGDKSARDRYLSMLRDTDRPTMRARMIKLAGKFNWLTGDEQRNEMVKLLGEVLAAKSMGPTEVDFVCSLNAGRELDPELPRLTLSPATAGRAAQNAALACLGSPEGHARALQALTSTDPQDLHVAQVYFRHRPLSDKAELRAVASAIGRMPGSEAQVRALDTLALQYVADRESLEELVRLFPLSESVNVQRAIAGILIRSDYKSIARPELIRVLSSHRLRSPDGEDVIDMLIRRLRVS